MNIDVYLTQAVQWWMYVFLYKYQLVNVNNYFGETWIRFSVLIINFFSSVRTFVWTCDIIFYALYLWEITSHCSKENHYSPYIIQCKTLKLSLKLILLVLLIPVPYIHLYIGIRIFFFFFRKIFFNLQKFYR